MGHPPGVDLVGIADNQGLLGLAENPGQVETGDASGSDQVPEDVARAHRRQLVGISDKQHLAVLGDRFQQGRGQGDVEHRALVHDEKVGLDGGRLVLFEFAVVPFQQAVDGFRLFPDHVAHALSGPPGGRGHEDRAAHGLREPDQYPGGGGLAAPGTAGQNGEASARRYP